MSAAASGAGRTWLLEGRCLIVDRFRGDRRGESTGGRTPAFSDYGHHPIDLSDEAYEVRGRPRDPRTHPLTMPSAQPGANS